MINPQVLQKVQDVVGAPHLLTSQEDRLCYAYDAANLLHVPEAVAFPGSTEEVASLLRLANEYRFPVVPRGAGTGTTGGAVAVQGGLVVVTTRLNRILEIDTDNFLAVVEPGVITGHLKAAAAKEGLYYPPDPSSASFCTIGGNVAENAGGSAAVKYGVTRDYVLGLKVVLPTGQIIDTGVKTAKGVVGYDLTRLLVGSEGTLGIITRIILRLVTQPAARQTLLAGFSDISRATQTVGRILKARLGPCALEFLDRASLECVRDLLPFDIPPQTQALLLLEVDGHPHDVRDRVESMDSFCRGQEAAFVLAAASAPEAEKLWQARKLLSPASFKLKPHKLSEDVVVPISLIPDLVASIEILSRELDLPIMCFGHAGDGNIHVNVMYDQQQDRERQAAGQAVEKIFTVVRELGGTLSGEHGVGLTKSPYIGMELSEAAIALSLRLKKAFDPNNIMNPGKIFSPPAPPPSP
ncbi:MAG: FAD-binding protein [Deltaproteobacteria bacterium]|nr:FAD-binding protein [Deltaproteobacteria bacterium]